MRRLGGRSATPLRLLRDWRGARRRSCGCPDGQPLVSELNGYHSNQATSLYCILSALPGLQPAAPLAEAAAQGTARQGAGAQLRRAAGAPSWWPAVGWPALSHASRKPKNLRTTVLARRPALRLLPPPAPRWPSHSPLGGLFVPSWGQAHRAEDAAAPLPWNRRLPCGDHLALPAPAATHRCRAVPPPRLHQRGERVAPSTAELMEKLREAAPLRTPLLAGTKRSGSVVWRYYLAVGRLLVPPLCAAFLARAPPSDSSAPPALLDASVPEDTQKVYCLPHPRAAVAGCVGSGVARRRVGCCCCGGGGAVRGLLCSEILLAARHRVSVFTPSPPQLTRVPAAAGWRAPRCAPRWRPSCWAPRPRRCVREPLDTSAPCA